MISPFREDFIFTKLRICEVSRILNPRKNFRIYSKQFKQKRVHLCFKERNYLCFCFQVARWLPGQKTILVSSKLCCWDRTPGGLSWGSSSWFPAERCHRCTGMYHRWVEYHIFRLSFKNSLFRVYTICRSITILHTNSEFCTTLIFGCNFEFAPPWKGLKNGANSFLPIPIWNKYLMANRN